MEPKFKYSTTKVHLFVFDGPPAIELRYPHNQKIAIQACKHIFQELRTARKGDIYWMHVEKDFRKIINSEDYDDRINKVKEYVDKPDLGYKKDEWVDDAVKDRKGEDLEASVNFENTHWYKFQLAAKRTS